jgi:hypothetical protein
MIRLSYIYYLINTNSSKNWLYVNHFILIIFFNKTLKYFKFILNEYYGIRNLSWKLEIKQLKEETGK